MSASLVGSEMCIRDRLWQDRHAGEQEAVLRVADAVRRVRAAPAGAAKPVSYTHLTLPTICSV
eukprot:14689268-Alexandrium_andersonii.AAC.1